MHTLKDPVIIVSDDPSFGPELLHRLQDDGYTATLQRSDASPPNALAEQHPGLLVVHTPNADKTSMGAGALAECVQQALGIEDVPVIVCADHRAVRQEAVKQLAQHRGVVMASSCQVEEVRAKLHDLVAHHR